PLLHRLADVVLRFRDRLRKVCVGVGGLGVGGLTQLVLQIGDFLVDRVLGLFEIGDRLFFLRLGGRSIGLVEIFFRLLHVALGIVQRRGGVLGGIRKIGGGVRGGGGVVRLILGHTLHLLGGLGVGGF